MLTAKELESFRKVLTQLQARLLGDVDQIQEDAFSGRESEHGSTNHMADMGSDAWEIDISLRMMENDEEFLKEVSTALAKIDEGTFGLCETCLENGVPRSRAWIPKTRLKAIPYARNCVSCERTRETES